MKAPDLTSIEEAGVHAWSGALEPLKSAAAAAHLKLATADLARAKDKASLFAELDRSLGLPDHFGHNWDALADVLEDRDWLGKTGRAIVFTGSAAFRRAPAGSSAARFRRQNAAARCACVRPRRLPPRSASLPAAETRAARTSGR